MKSSKEKLVENKGSFWVLFIIGFAVLPFLYGEGLFSIGDINMLGRYMSFAILALGLGLLWGYVGILSLCQFTFFCLGAYAMGCLLYTSPSPRDRTRSRMPSSA